MVFEAKNAYYETEEKIDELSIQDQIDKNKLEINQLTKANLKKLRVDILNKNSHLRIRDENGKIIGKLKDNQVVDFNGERKSVKYNGTEKVFLGINYKKGNKIIKGFVSADYVKGDVLKTPEIKDKAPLDDKVKDSKPSTNYKTEEKTDTSHSSVNTQTSTEIKSEEVTTNLKEKEENILPNSVAGIELNSVPTVTRQESENTIQSSKEAKEIVKNEYVIKRSKKGIIMPGPDGTEYIINPSLDRRFLKTKNAKARFNTISNIIDIWTYNAHKVAENDAFLDTTKKAIHNSANNILKKINNAKNSIFENEKEYKKFVNEIFKEIIKTEDDQRDIIDEEDMKEVYNLVLDINSNNQQEKILKIYDLMRVGLTPGDDGDSTIIKEKLSDDLIETPDFKFVGEIIKKIQNSEKILHQEDIDNILNGVKLPKVDRLTEQELKDIIKENLQKTINELNKAQIGQEEQLKNGYNNFIKAYKLDQNIFSFDQFKAMQINSTFAKLAKHMILKTTLEASYDRGNQDSTKKGMYADIIGLSESGTTWSRMDYFSIADENIDYAEEIAGTIATSLIPGGLAYVGAKWAFTLGKAGIIMAKGGTFGKNTLKVSEFLTRTGAGYIGSEAYSSIKDKQWHGTRKGYLEFMALDGILSTAGKLVGKINTSKNFIYKIPKSKFLAKTLVAGTSTEAMVNFPRWLEGKEIEFNLANWTKEDITLVLMLAATHGAGKGFEKIKATKTNDGIKVETINKKTTKYYQGKQHKYKLENGEWYNISTGKKLKNKPKNITEISKPEKIKSEEINTEAQEILTDTLNSKFKEYFNDYFEIPLFGKAKTKALTLSNESGKTITIKLNSDKKFTINGDNKIYTKKEILEKIKKDYPEYEKNFLKQKALENYQHIKNNKETFITDRHGFLLRPNERVTERGLEIKKNGKFEKANQAEIDAFLNNNPKIEKLLSKSFVEKINKEIKDKGLKTALIENKGKIIKEILLGKNYFNLWFPALISVATLDDYKNAKMSDFLEKIAITYVASATLNGIYMTIAGGTKLFFSIKPIKKTGKFLLKHKWKIAGATALGGSVYMYEKTN